MNVKRGDIIWLKKDTPSFNIGENVQHRNRPYIVISNNKNNDKSPTINLACISKQVKKLRYPMHVFLDKNKYNLKYDSVIFTEQLCTINKSYIEQIISSLDHVDMKKFNKALYIQVFNEKGSENIV